MRIKLFAAGAAIALAATIGSASAADQFSTLGGIAAEAMAPQEMGAVTGADTGETMLFISGAFTFAGGDHGGCGEGCHAFHFPMDAGAAAVLSSLPGGVEPASGSETNLFFAAAP